MPTTLFPSMVTGAIAAAGVALASFTGVHDSDAYAAGELKKLTTFDASYNAEQTFKKADRNQDQALDVDEYASLSIVTAELAQLNGFIAVEKDATVQTISLPASGQQALSASEHARIDAVARHTFYAFAGGDGKMQQGEYISLQKAIFNSSDLNANGALARTELSIFARRQAYLRPEA